MVRVERIELSSRVWKTRILADELYPQNMVPAEGFEPPTCGIEAHRSNPLSYRGAPLRINYTLFSAKILLARAVLVAAQKRDSETDKRADQTEHPEAHGDLSLLPALGFEVMMDRCGNENAAAKEFFRQNLCQA